MDRPCLPNQNLMSFILLMKYCQGLSEKHQRDRVATRFRLRLLLDIIEKIKHTNTNDHQPLTIKHHSTVLMPSRRRRHPSRPSSGGTLSQ